MREAVKGTLYSCLLIARLPFQSRTRNRPMGWGVVGLLTSIMTQGKAVNGGLHVAAVPHRNWTLFSYVFQPHAVMQLKYANTQLKIFGNAVEICNWIMFDFYPGLPHIHVYTFLRHIQPNTSSWWFHGWDLVWGQQFLQSLQFVATVYSYQILKKGDYNMIHVDTSLHDKVRF